MGTTEPSGLCIRPLWSGGKLCGHRKQCRSRVFAGPAGQPNSFVVVLRSSTILLYVMFDTIRDSTKQELCG